MKIAHISDLHLCSSFKRNNIAKTKRLIKYHIDAGFDHLVITGDISDNTEEKDWVLLKNILKSFGIYHRDKVTIVIGNHDIYGGVQTALDILNFPKRCLETDYYSKIKKFILTFRELHEDVIYSFPNIYPFTKIVKDHAFIAVNTIDFYARFTNPFASNGRVYSADYTNLKNHLTSPDLIDKKVIVLAHHHFYKNNCESTSSYSSIWNSIEKYTMKLRGKKKLIKLFANNRVKLVLHGHSHQIKQYVRKDIMFVNAGGVVDNMLPATCTAILIDTDFNSPIVEIKDVNLKEKISNLSEKKLILTAV